MEVNELAAGCAAGLTQDAFLHPLDTVRARLDMGASSLDSIAAATRRAEGPAAALMSEARALGLGVYRGYGWCLCASAPCNAVYFGSYSSARRLLGGGKGCGESSALTDAGAGFVAEAIASLLWTPADVIKQRLQVGPSGMRAADAARAAYDRAGSILGLQRGYFAGLAVWGPFSASYFAAYEALIRQLGGHEAAGMREDLTAGVTAGAAAALSTQPLDCAKTRIQVGAVPQDMGLLAVIEKVWRVEGAGALWRGAVARALWLAPGCGITITIFQAVSGVLSDTSKSKDSKTRRVAERAD